MTVQTAVQKLTSILKYTDFNSFQNLTELNKTAIQQHIKITQILTKCVLTSWTAHIFSN